MDDRIKAELKTTLGILAADKVENKGQIRAVLEALQSGVLTEYAKSAVRWRSYPNMVFDSNILDAPEWWHAL